MLTTDFICHKNLSSKLIFILQSGYMILKQIPKSSDRIKKQNHWRIWPTRGIIVSRNISSALDITLRTSTTFVTMTATFTLTEIWHDASKSSKAPTETPNWSHAQRCSTDVLPFNVRRESDLKLLYTSHLHRWRYKSTLVSDIFAIMMYLFIKTDMLSYASWRDV